MADMATRAAFSANAGRVRSVGTRGSISTADHRRSYAPPASMATQDVKQGSEMHGLKQDVVDLPLESSGQDANATKDDDLTEIFYEVNTHNPPDLKDSPRSGPSEEEWKPPDPLVREILVEHIEVDQLPDINIIAQTFSARFLIICRFVGGNLDKDLRSIEVL